MGIGSVALMICQYSCRTTHFLASVFRQAGLLFSREPGKRELDQAQCLDPTRFAPLRWVPGDKGRRLE
jgi:hypothetical protein